MYRSVSLEKECFRLLSDIFHKDGITDQGKAANKHRIGKCYKWEYIFKEKQDVEHRDNKISCGYKLFPSLKYTGNMKIHVGKVDLDGIIF